MVRYRDVTDRQTDRQNYDSWCALSTTLRSVRVLVRSVECFKEVQDSLCVAQSSRDGTDERVVLFLKMAPGIALSAELIKQVRMSIRKELSARHVPAVILQTTDIPVCYVLSLSLSRHRYR